MYAHRFRVGWGSLLALAVLSSCSSSCRNSGEEGNEGDMTIRVESAAFEAGGAIPERYTADGDDVSPPLTWSNLPEGAVELALICDDPDAPRDEPWVHWVIYGIPGGTGGLPEALATEETLSEPLGARQGQNDFGRIGYGGPAPPRGHGTHHYHFILYALDMTLDLAAGAEKAELLESMEGHILARGELVGTYSRE